MSTSKFASSSNGGGALVMMMASLLLLLLTSFIESAPMYQLDNLSRTSNGYSGILTLTQGQ